VRIGLDHRVAVLLVEAKLAQAGEGGFADEGECLVATQLSVGVDRGQPDPVALAAIEVDDAVGCRDGAVQGSNQTK
jgi:hypothetical protein